MQAQETGKFRSLESTSVLFKSSKRSNLKKNLEYEISLKQEKEYSASNLTSLTASSEESPIRAENRVKRAAQLVAQAYLEDVQLKVKKVEQQFAGSSLQAQRHEREELALRGQSRLD